MTIQQNIQKIEEIRKMNIELCKKAILKGLATKKFLSLSLSSVEEFNWTELGLESQIYADIQYNSKTIQVLHDLDKALRNARTRRYVTIK